MIYIGSPYSDPSFLVMDDRAYQAGCFAAYMAKQGHVVYCPIASWHHLAKEHAMPRDFPFWSKMNLDILSRSEELWVLQLGGWENSRGLAEELKFAEVMHIPTRFFDGITFEETT